MTTQQIWSTALYAVFLVPIFFLARKALKRAKSAEGFLVSNWNIPLPILIATLAASLGTAAYFLAAMSMGISGSAWEGLSTTFGLGVCMFLAGVCWAAPIRRLRGWTMADFYGLRFASKALGTYCGVVMSVGTSVFMVGAFAVGGAYLISAITGISFVWAAIIYCAIVGTYCIMGGLWAVAYTDTLQVILLSVSYLAIMGLIIFKANAASPGALMSAEHWNLSYLFTWRGSLFWFLFLAIAIGDIPANDMGQRACGGRTPRETKKAFLWAGVILAVLGIVPAFASEGLKILYPNFAGNTEYVWIQAVIDYTHPALAGLLLTLFISAGMSTIDSSYVAATATWIKNLGMDAFGIKYEHDEKKMVRASRIIVAIIVLISCLMAIFFQKAIVLAYAVFEIIFVSLTWPVVIGPFWKRLSAKANWVAITAGLVVYIGFTVIFTDTHFFGGINVPIAVYSETLPGLGGMIVGIYAFPVFWGATVSLICTIIFGLIFKPSKEEELAYWMQRTKANDDVIGYPDHERGTYEWQAVHTLKGLRENYQQEGVDMKALVDHYFDGLPAETVTRTKRK